MLPDDPWKVKFDILITFLLFFVMFVTPYRIAFVEIDDYLWVFIDEFIDLVFLVDIIITFFTAYYNSKYILVANKR